MEGNNEDSSSSNKRKTPAGPSKRVVKDLPPSLAALTHKDIDKFVLAMDRDVSKHDGKEVICAIGINMPPSEDGGDPIYWDIKKLSSDEHKKLAKCIGAKGCGSVSTFQMRHIMGACIKWQLSAAQSGLSVVPDATRASNTLF